MIIRQKGTEVSYIELRKEDAISLVERITVALSRVEEFGDSVLVSYDHEEHLANGRTFPTRITFEVGTY